MAGLASGDLGFVDRHGALFVTGRVKEVLVLGGGKKVDPEELEHIYGEAPEIAEIAVLEQDGVLVALVRPDPAVLYSRGATNLRDGIRVILGERPSASRHTSACPGLRLPASRCRALASGNIGAFCYLPSMPRRSPVGLRALRERRRPRMTRCCKIRALRRFGTSFGTFPGTDARLRHESRPLI